MVYISGEEGANPKIQQDSKGFENRLVAGRRKLKEIFLCSAKASTSEGIRAGFAGKVGEEH